MTKERGEKVISLQQFLDLVTKIYEQYQFSASDDTSLQKLSLINKLIDHFHQEFIPLFNKATEQSRTLMIQVKTNYDAFIEILNKIKLESFRWLKLDFDIENINEYKEIHGIYRKADQIIQSKFDNVILFLKDMSREDKSKFYFRHSEHEAYFFNPKLFLISTEHNKLKTAIDKYKEFKEKIYQVSYSHNEKRKSLEESLAEKKNVKYQLTASLSIILSNLLKDPLPNTQIMKLNNTSLRNIQEKMYKHKKSITVIFDNINKSLTLLDDIMDHETKVASIISESKQLMNNLKLIYDINGYKEIVTEFLNKIRELEENYLKTAADFRLPEPSKLYPAIRKLRSTITSIYCECFTAKNKIIGSGGEYLSLTGKSIQNMRSITKALARKHKFEVEEIVDKLNSLQKKIEVNNISELKTSLSIIENEKKKIDENITNRIKSLLNEKEINVLIFLSKRLKKGDNEWISKEEIIPTVCNDLGLAKSDVLAAINKLIIEGLFIDGVSLAF